ncbi:hypothetical protein MHY87_18630, partial [Microvirga sp. ACRRW]|uniref:calcium-binding protein n=1 Tax=Microvirga sp. ACRRW TaxID=2918205 RepID=UPI001EF6C184|nr:hypothetical protein [Microvirga sp. ACRRW]
MKSNDWDGHIVQYTDMQGVAAASVHFGGGTSMSRLEAEMNRYFDGTGAKITYGGSTIGNEVQVVQITLKPGVKVKENPDGTVTISVVNSKEGTTAVVKLDKDGKVVEAKSTKVEYTADGGAFQRITDQDGNVRDVTLVHGGEGKTKPSVFIDPDTGNLTVVSVTSEAANTKTVATFREDGGLINRIDYDYDLLEDGRIVEHSVDMNGQHHSREIIGIVQDGQVSTLTTNKGGFVYATTTLPDGNYVLVTMTQSSARAVTERIFHETRSDGSVIQKYIGGDGTVVETVLIEGREGSERPVMVVEPSGTVIFSVNRADGSRTYVALDNAGFEFSGGTRTYELGPNGSAVLKFYDNQTETTTTRTLLEAKEGAGVPVLERDQDTGEFIIRAFQADGSEIAVRMDEAGWKEVDKYRLSLEEVGGELHQIYESFMYSGDDGFARMRIRAGNWSDFIGTKPPEGEAQSRPDVIHGQGGVRDAWDSVLDWSLHGVPVLGEKIQTIGDADWKGWTENGGTVNRQSVDFTGSGIHKGVEKALRLKAGGAGHDVMHGAGGLDVFYGGAGNDTLSGGGDSDLLSGEDGNDVVDGGDGKDALHGGHGDDTIHGGAGDDLLDDGLAGTKDGVNVTGNDSMDGGDGNDRIDGRLGHDTLIGGAGNDSLIGGDGNDRLDGGDGKDFLSGGRGEDTLLGGAGDDRLSGNDGNDTIEGASGNDVIDGGHGNDVLDGGEGNDVLDGWSGDDVANGGNGDDTILGSLGADTLNGGAGVDTADYSASGGWIHLDLASGFAGGSTGTAAQGDRLISIENVLGSKHGDTIIVGNASGQYFDFGDYLAKNGDVRAHILANNLGFDWAYTHWLTWGRFEG